MAPTRIPAKIVTLLPERLRPRKSPRQRRAQELVNAVLEAGSRILIARGYEQLSMQQVGRVAGVSPGSLYQYFPDKAALVAALVDRISERELAFHVERFEELPPGSTLEATLRHVIESVVAFQRQEGPLMRRCLDALAYLGRYPALAERTKGPIAFVRAIFERHRAEIAVDDLDLATHVIANAMHSLTHDGIAPRPASLDDETLVREVMRLTMGYLTRRSPH
jgi:AcrR family transcriptional regulator